MFKFKMKNKFTLIELVVVITIIGILAALLIPQIGGITDDAEQNVSEMNAKTIQSSLELFRTKYGVYPSTFHSGRSSINSADTSSQMPADIAFNFNNASTTMNDSGMYVDSNQPNVVAALNAGVSSKQLAYIVVDGTKGCGISLNRAGITHLFVGDVDKSTTIANLVPYNAQTSDKINLTHINGFYKGTMDRYNEVVVNGRTIREWYGQQFAHFEAISCIIPLFITDGFGFVALDNANNVIASDMGLQIPENANGSPFKYVAFFACDMVPKFGGVTIQRPAALIGVVPVENIPTVQ